MQVKFRKTLISITFLFAIFIHPIPIFADGDKTVNELFQNERIKETEQESGTGERSNQQSDALSPSGGIAGLIIKTILSLALILLLIYGMVRVLSLKNINISSNRFMAVKSGISLGQNKSLKLVKVGSVYYLLGVGENVQLIKEISSLEEVEELDRWQPAPAESSIDSIFKNIKGAWKRKSGKDTPDGVFHKQLDEQIQQLKAQRNQLNGLLDDKGSSKGKGEL